MSEFEQVAMSADPTYGERFNAVKMAVLGVKDYENVDALQKMAKAVLYVQRHRHDDFSLTQTVNWMYRHLDKMPVILCSMRMGLPCPVFDEEGAPE